jgi:hypothetical protein
MRLKSFFSILAGAALIFSACSPEEYEMGAKTYVSDDLVEGIAYTVTPDANDPNTIRSSREPLPCGSLQAVLLKRPLLTWHFLLPENIA